MCNFCSNFARLFMLDEYLVKNDEYILQLA